MQMNGAFKFFCICGFGDLAAMYYVARKGWYMNSSLVGNLEIYVDLGIMNLVPSKNTSTQQ